MKRKTSARKEYLTYFTPNFSASKDISFRQIVLLFCMLMLSFKNSAITNMK